MLVLPDSDDSATDFLRFLLSGDSLEISIGLK